ncbi:MAG: hypothetical protein AB8B65_04035 [Kordia sp.]|uniref:hypothetical protein n=1 Tax=Kordia sp. TaxID=1965332 RepID=UPI00385D1B87
MGGGEHQYTGNCSRNCSNFDTCWSYEYDCNSEYRTACPTQLETCNYTCGPARNPDDIDVGTSEC